MESADRLIERIVQCPTLPVIPGISLQVLQLVEDPNADAERITEVMGRDPALAARVLRAANNLTPRTVSSLRHAVALLGMRSVNALALGVSMGATLRHAGLPSEGLESLWRRGLYSALAGRLLSNLTRLAPEDEVFLCGLFQDVGVLGMLAVLGSEYEVLLGPGDDHELLMAIEHQVLGTDHSAVGEAMAKAWKLPERLTTPIAYHHRPDEAPAEARAVVQVAWAARVVADVLLADDTQAAARQAHEVLTDGMGLDDRDIQDMLSKLAIQAQDLGRLFEVDALSGTELQRVLLQAQEALVKVAMDADADVRRLGEANRKLIDTANRDYMTGLYSRCCLDKVKNSLFEEARAKDMPFSVLFVDADRFKSINDEHGHAAGDEAIRRFGRIIGAIGGDSTYRFGGEEFVVLLPGSDEKGAMEIAERIRTAVQGDVLIRGGKRIQVTVSIGVSATDAVVEGLSADQLISCADQAAYAAKRDGRNRVRIIRSATAGAA